MTNPSPSPGSALARLAAHNRLLQDALEALLLATEAREWATLPQVAAQCPHPEGEVREALLYLGERKIIEPRWSGCRGFEWKLRR